MVLGGVLAACYQLLRGYCAEPPAAAEEEDGKVPRLACWDGTRREMLLLAEDYWLDQVLGREQVCWE